MEAVKKPIISNKEILFIKQIFPIKSYINNPIFFPIFKLNLIDFNKMISS